MIVAFRLGVTALRYSLARGPSGDMKHSLIAGATLAALAIGWPALAADMSVKAPMPATALYDWSGIFGGGHLGYLWGAARVEENGIVTEDRALTNGVVGGVLAGLNLQNGAIVWGIEGDVGFSNARGTGQAAEEIPNIYKISLTDHVRGKVGIATDNNLLFFLAGGLAAADFRFTPGETQQREGAYFVGGSIGGGFEYGMTPQIAGRVELIYDDLGSKTYVQGTDSYRVHLTGTTVRGALTVKLWNGH